MPLTLLNWLLALTPVLAVIVLMLVFKWGGGRAGAVSWMIAVGIAMLFFGAGLELIAYTQVKAILLSLDVLYIIWAGLLLFHIANEAGAIQMIGERLPKLTGDRVMQALLVGWLLVSFLQGMGGFGVPVAICAPILIGLGFGPIQSVVMAAIGHGWAVNFGSLATSFQSLMAVTGLPGEMLAPAAALLLGVAAFPCGAIVAYLGCGWKGLKRALPAVIILSAVMGGVQYILVTNGVWTLGATGAAIAGLVVAILLMRLPRFKSRQSDALTNDQASAEPGKEKPKSFLVTVSAYIILVVLAFLINLIPGLKAFLSQVKLTLQFPALSTSSGWITEAGPGRMISIFGHPGAILLYTSIIAYLIYWRAGYLSPKAFGGILKKVGRGAVNSSLGIIAMIGLASVMMHSGMTNMLARGLSESFNQSAYPAIAPFIGALGAFITGSNNSSNVLFAVMQQETAALLNLSIPLILAAQTAGGSLGSIMSPAKVIVGCSTVGLSKKEGIVMRRILLYGIIPLVIVAVLTILLNLV